VTVVTVEPADGYALRRVFTGRVEAARRSPLGFERAGLLQEVLVEEGAPVRAGQTLARLDRALLLAQRKEREAALREAEANRSLAEATLQRYQHSVERGAVTRQALDEAREQARAAQASVAFAAAQIASLDVDLAKTELRAPFAGVVIGRLADEGRVLPAGEPVLELQEQAAPEIRIGLAGPLVDTLRLEQPYSLRWRGRSFPVRLRAVLPVRALGTRTVDALFVPTATGMDLRPGELVELEISDWLEQSGVWLPLSALAEGARGLWNAYVAEPLNAPSPTGLQADHRIDARPVEIVYQDGERAFVRGPLRAGERVVEDGLHRVVPGQWVRVPASAPERVALRDR
jgi:RND family efflux transporter MFP subunit